MAYSQPEDIFLSLGSNSQPSTNIAVLFNNNNIGDIAGPQPLVSINNNFVRTAAGDLENLTTTINLNGKIALFNPSYDAARPSGISTLVGKIKNLEDLFKKNTVGTFVIASGDLGSIDTNENFNPPDGAIFVASGVKVKSLNIDKSNDNWMFSADYSVEMEYSRVTPNQANGANALVSNTVDTWSIEPIEDYVWSSYLATISKADNEYHNPKILPAITDNGTNLGGGGNNTLSLLVANIPQYRITHRLSAVGIAHDSPSHSGQFNRAYLEAKKWVEYRAARVFDGANNSSSDLFLGYPHFTDDAQNIQSFTNIFLYNHLRSTNFSINEGSYELSDTWLAMPSGIKFVEDYTVESSTDDRNVKTVRVQGSIKGLSLSTFSAMSRGGVVENTSGTGQIFLSDYVNSNQSGMLSDVDYVYDSQQHSSNNNFNNTKYENALSGWLNDVKPYLYHRASTVINSSDRNRDYVDSTTTSRDGNQTTKPPGNPIYSYEKALRINPIGSTEGHDMKKGTISYSYEYNNKGLNLISGVLSESISINDTGPTDVISETVVLGRALGPVIQSLGTKTATKRDVAIEVTVNPPTGIEGVLMTNSKCPVYISGTTYLAITNLIAGLKPFGGRAGGIFGNMNQPAQPGNVYIASDSHSWDATNGRYSRNVSWIYQHCQNNFNNYLENT